MERLREDKEEREDGRLANSGRRGGGSRAGLPSWGSDSGHLAFFLKLLHKGGGGSSSLGAELHAAALRLGNGLATRNPGSKLRRTVKATQKRHEEIKRGVTKDLNVG